MKLWVQVPLSPFLFHYICFFSSEEEQRPSKPTVMGSSPIKCSTNFFIHTPLGGSKKVRFLVIKVVVFCLNFHLKCKINVGQWWWKLCFKNSYILMVNYLPSKQKIWVRFSLAVSPLRLRVRTPPFHGGNTGSNPVGDIDVFVENQGLIFLIFKAPRFYHDKK